MKTAKTVLDWIALVAVIVVPVALIGGLILATMAGEPGTGGYPSGMSLGPAALSVLRGILRMMFVIGVARLSRAFVKGKSK